MSNKQLVKKNADAHVKQIAAQEIVRLNRRELQLCYVFTYLQAANITSGGNIYALSNIAQGDGISQRRGDAIRFVSFNMTYELVQLNSDIYSDVRVCIFQWMENTGLINPVIADVYQSLSAIGLYSPHAFALRDSVKVLYDSLHSLSGITTNPTSTSNMSFLNVPLQRLPKAVMNFNAGATTGYNQLFAALVSDTSLAPFVLGNFSWELYFHNA